MSEPFPMPEDPLDALVRSRLDADARNVDADKLLADVQAKLAETQPARPNRLVRYASAFAALAAALFVALWRFPTPASAETILEEARKAHEQPIDFGYSIHFEVEGGLANRFPLLNIHRGQTLWTRGDRFYIENQGERPWAWGRDEQGRVWLALNRKTGLIYNRDEPEDGVAATLDMYEMHVPSLLAELLAGFDLKSERLGADRSRVIAVPRGADHPIQMVTVDIDRTNRRVERVEIKRMMKGERIGTIRFQLEKSSRLPDAVYTLAGHLDADARRFGPDRPLLRAPILRRLLDKKGAG